MKTYSSDDKQFLYCFCYTFENKEYSAFVVAFDEEWAMHKFTMKYPNVKRDTIRNDVIGEAIV